MNKLEFQSKALAHSMQVYAAEVKKFSEKIDNISQRLNLAFSIQETNTKKYDHLRHVAIGFTTHLAIFFGGPLGYAIATTGRMLWEASQGDGPKLAKATNMIMALVTSDITNQIMTATVPGSTQEKIFSYKMSSISGFNEFGNTYKNSSGIDSKDRYRLLNCINNFHEYMVRKKVPDAVQAKTPQQQIQFLEKYQKEYAEYTLEKAIRCVVIATYQLRSAMYDNKVLAPAGERIYANMHYKAISSIIESVQVKSSHAGSDHRKILERFFYDKDLISADNVQVERQLAAEVKDDYMQRVLDARRQFGWEWLAKDTDYNRMFSKLAIAADNGKNEGRKHIYHKDKTVSETIFSAYNNVLHSQVSDEYFVCNLRGEDMHGQINLDRYAFFKLLDTKCCLWAYFGDYSDYFSKKIKSNVKLDMAKYLPSMEIDGQGIGITSDAKSILEGIDKYWRENHYTFQGRVMRHRLQDLSVIYLLIKIPEIILGCPIESYVIEGENVSEVNVAIAKYLLAIYLAVHSVICFSLEESSKQTTSGTGRNDISYDDVGKACELGSIYLKKLSNILFSPLYRFHLDSNMDAANQEKATILGFSNEMLDKNHNACVQLDIYNNISQLCASDWSNFARATTPIANGLESEKLDMVSRRLDSMLNNHINDYLKGGNAYAGRKSPENTVSSSYIKSYPDFATHSDIAKSYIQGERAFSDISEHYKKYGVTTVTSGLSVSEGSNQFDNGANYLTDSLMSVEKSIHANTKSSDLNRRNRYAAIRKSFYKQRLSMQAYQKQKVSALEVFENMEETMLLLIAELYDGDIKKLQDESVDAGKFQLEQNARRHQYYA